MSTLQEKADSILWILHRMRQKASACGAGSSGDPGFDQNNTCARGSGGGSSGDGTSGGGDKKPPKKEQAKSTDSFKSYSGGKAEKTLGVSKSQWSEGDGYFDNRAVKAYAGTSDSFQINDCLRKKCGDKRLVDKGNALASVIDKASFPESIKSFRTINPKSVSERNKILKQFKDNVGGEFTDNAFVSTSANKKYADSWAGDQTGKTPPLKVEVLVPKGSKAIYIPKDVTGRQEWEVLLQRGAKFKVHSATDDQITLEYI